MNLNSRTATLATLYPSRTLITGQAAINMAQDALATGYLKANPGAPPEAVDENSRVGKVSDAIAILEDLGLVTFTQAATDSAAWHEENELAARGGR